LAADRNNLARASIAPGAGSGDTSARQWYLLLWLARLRAGPFFFVG